MAFTVKQSNPAANTNADLYTVPAGKEAVISTLSVAEFGGSPATIRVLVRPAGASAANIHTLIHAAEILANETQFFTIGIALAAGDIITVRSTTTGIAFSAFVNESVV